MFLFYFSVILVFSLSICFLHGLAFVLHAVSLVWIAKTGTSFPERRDETWLADETSF